MKKHPLLVLLFTLIFISCKKDSNIASNENAAPVLTEKEKHQVAFLAEVAEVLKDVYKDPYAFYEVNAAIYCEYYTDESVLLKDLLIPEISPLYKTDRFLSFNAIPGKFSTSFFEVLSKGNFPLLKKDLKGVLESKANLRANLIMAVTPAPIDTAGEVFSIKDGVGIYFPYSENFTGNFTSSYFSNVNKDPEGNLATIVSPQNTETDSGPGSKPHKCRPDPSAPRGEWDICYSNVTVDDAYAEQSITHCLRYGADVRVSDNPTPTPTSSVTIVYIGDVMCTSQYDKFLSLSKLNGGGPDLRFTRGDGYLQRVNGQVTNSSGDLPVDLKRKDVRKSRWKRVYAVWDTNWEEANLNQMFGIWEEDKSGSQTYSGTVSTTLNNSTTGTGTTTGNTTVNSIGYSYTVTSKDPIIRQLSWNRASFFQYNHGGLINGCGTKDGWQIYDCSQTVRYTMPTQ